MWVGKAVPGLASEWHELRREYFAAVYAERFQQQFDLTLQWVERAIGAPWLIDIRQTVVVPMRNANFMGSAGHVSWTSNAIGHSQQ